MKAGATFNVQADTPGVVLRATLFAGPKMDYPGAPGAFGAVAQGEPSPLCGAPTPTTWAKFEGILEIPEGEKKIIPFVFSWKSVSNNATGTSDTHPIYR